MPDGSSMKLRVVDGFHLPAEYRAALMPDGRLRDSFGHARPLPRFFYEINSWEEAQRTQLTPNFAMWELIQTDVREAQPLRGFPRYVPCAVTMLAIALQRLRDHIGTSVNVAANGGYRSPSHALTCRASLHCWATAADIYRVGDTFLNTPERIEKYASIAQQVLPGVWTHPVGHGAEQTDDHLHLDLGFVLSVPHNVRIEQAILSEVHA